VYPVSLLRAEAGTSPSGTGSYSYFTNFYVLVENLAYVKIVQIWGHNVDSGTWNFYPCNYSSSVAGNGEIWTAHTGARIDQFVAQYQVLGNTWWDNNAGFNYLLSTTAAESTDGVGTAVLKPNVLAVEWGADGAGTLEIDVLVKNLGYSKQVGVIYTTNNWATSHTTLGGYQQGLQPSSTPQQISAELWEIMAPVGTGLHGQFAVFYNVNGGTLWDNNYGANYTF
jgi:hypothetical protein